MQPALLLNDGTTRIPQLGLGVFRAAAGKVTREAVRAALELGYRHIDTARIYDNEQDVGAGLRDSQLARDEVFVTTKLWNADQGYDSALRACERSLERLGLDAVDLYLIHWPLPGKRLESWRALVRLREQGLCRAIGVSNFLPRHLEELLASSDVRPAVNQIELSPFNAQRETLALCRREGIVVEAYSPLTKGQRLQDPRIVAIAARHGRSPAQVLIRWCIEQDLVVLPKSVHAERMRQNAEVFDFTLDAEARRVLDGLDEGLYTGWDPTDVP